MLSRDIMALHVNNLSDARYFSALGVKWMVFDIAMSVDNVEDIREMLNWIAGPIPILHSTDGQAHYAHWLCEELKVDYLLVESRFLEDFEDGGATIIPFGTYKESADWSEKHPFHVVRCTPDEVRLTEPEAIIYLEGMNRDSFVAITSEQPHKVFAIRGGEEEKTGLKDYDELNATLEHLLV